MDQIRIDLAKYRIAKASDELQGASILLSENLLRESLSSSYYAIFHAARALLALEGYDSKKHNGVIYLFIEHFIKNGVIEKSFQRILTKAFDVRIESDYKDFFLVSRSETQALLSDATTFVKETKRIITVEYKIE